MARDAALVNQANEGAVLKPQIAEKKTGAEILSARSSLYLLDPNEFAINPH